MSVHDRKNLKSALESAILYLQKQGVEEARQDAWLLLEHVCGISHSTYFVHSEDEMPKEQQEFGDSELSWNPQRSCGCVSKAASAGDPLAGRMLCGCLPLEKRYRTKREQAGYL